MVAFSCFRALVGCHLFPGDVIPHPLFLYSWLALWWCSFSSSDFTYSSWKKRKKMLPSDLAYPSGILLELSVLDYCHASCFSSSQSWFSMSRDCWQLAVETDALPVGSISLGSLLQLSWAVSARHGSAYFPWSGATLASTKCPETWAVKVLLLFVKADQHYTFLITAFNSYVVPFSWSVFSHSLPENPAFSSVLGLLSSLWSASQFLSITCEFLELPLHFEWPCQIIS